MTKSLHSLGLILTIDVKKYTNLFLSFRILKLLNQRMLENLKEKWWAQNPNKATCEDDDSDTSGGIIE